MSVRRRSVKASEQIGAQLVRLARCSVDTSGKPFCDSPYPLYRRRFVLIGRGVDQTVTRVAIESVLFRLLSTQRTAHRHTRSVSTNV